jgi:hypothetical protein
MANPEIELRLPKSIYIGEPFVVEIELAVKQPFKLQHLMVRVTGGQRWRLGNDREAETTFPKYERVVRIEDRFEKASDLSCKVERGAHQFPVELELPPGTAPSHEISPTASRIFLEVLLGLSWRTERSERFTLMVRVPPPRFPRRTPVVARAPGEVGPHSQRIELALASSTVVPGEIIEGSCALFHMAADKLHDVKLSFVPMPMGPRGSCVKPSLVAKARSACSRRVRQSRFGSRSRRRSCRRSKVTITT